MTINPCFEGQDELVITAIGLLKKISVAYQAAMYILGGDAGDVKITLPNTNEGQAILVLVEKVTGQKFRSTEFEYKAGRGLVTNTGSTCWVEVKEDEICAIPAFSARPKQSVKFYVPEAVPQNCGGTMIFGGKVHHTDGSAESFTPLGIGPALDE